MSAQGNVHDGNVTEAQAAFLKAFTPLIIEMSRKDRARFIIGNPNLRANLRAWFAQMSETPVMQEPNLVFVKQTMFETISVDVYGFARRLSIPQMLRALVNLPDDASLGKIEELLKRRKHLISDVLFEQILAEQAKFFLKQEGGVDFGLPRGGLASFVPVENPDGSVSIMFVIWRQEDKWYRTEYSLEYENSWRRNNCLVVAKSDPSNL